MILVTGGAGFVGSHVVERLLADDERVRVLDACLAQPGEDGERARERFERWGDQRDRLDVVEGDVRDREVVREALEDVRSVVHLAAITGARRSLTAPVETIDVRARGTAVLLDEMERAKVPQLVLGSTAHVLGEGGPHPRDRAPRPVSPYGAAAAAAEAQALAWSASSRGRAVVVRLTSVYGPRMRPDQALFRFMEAMAEERPLPVLGSGDAVRDWLYVDDAVDALLAAVDTEDRTLVAHAGTGQGLSVLRMIEHLRAVTEAPAHVELFAAQDGDPHALLLETHDSEALLQWSPHVPLSDGLLRTWSWLLTRVA